MGLLQRLGLISKSKANAALDTIENPSEISDQIIRELKQSYETALRGQAEIKAIILGHRAKQQAAESKAKEWEAKVNELLDMMEKGKLETVKGERLAEDAANKVAAFEKEAAEYNKMATSEDSKFATLEKNTTKIKEQISEAETRVSMLKSRAKTAEVSEKVNVTLSSVKTDGLMDTLNRLEEKVATKEMVAEAYADVEHSASANEIDDVLSENKSSSALERIKAKRQSSTSEQS